MVLWLLISTRSCLLVVGLLSIAEALCPSLYLFGTILVTLCLMVWDWRVSRAEPMLCCWHDMLFLFCLLLFYICFPSMGWLCGVGVFGLIECPHSLPALHSRLQNVNNNNNNKGTSTLIIKLRLILVEHTDDLGQPARTNAPDYLQTKSDARQRVYCTTNRNTIV